MFEEILYRKGITTVSFDIFDTIILRTVTAPSDVFIRMYSHIRPYLPEGADKLGWRDIRRKAEREARADKEKNCGHREVTLDEIYEKMPPGISNTMKIKRTELQCEKEACYCNPVMLALIGRIKRETKLKIVLTSDMYLPEVHIRELLKEVGFPLNWLDHVFISCEAKVDKRSGDLFRHVLQQLELEPEEIIHVGDNPVGDVLRPSDLGIRAFFYGAVSECIWTNLFMELEDMMFGSAALGELRSLRSIVSVDGIPEEDTFWFDIGARIFGPLFCAAMETEEEIAAADSFRTEQFSGKLDLLILGKLPDGTAVMPACAAAGKRLRTFLYHENFEKSGAAKACLTGINTFRTFYLRIRKQKRTFPEIKWRENIILPIVRLFIYPLKKEAEMIGPWLDQETDENGGKWIPGCLAKEDPFYAYKLLTTADRIGPIGMVEKLLLDEPGPLVLVGAGAAGKQILRYLKAAGKEEGAVAFADQDRCKQGMTCYGRKIRMPEEFDSVYGFVICSRDKETAVQLKRQMEEITKRQAEGSKIYGI